MIQGLQRDLQARAVHTENQENQANNSVVSGNVQSRLQALEQQLSEQCIQCKVVDTSLSS